MAKKQEQIFVRRDYKMYQLVNGNEVALLVDVYLVNGNETFLIVEEIDEIVE